MKSSRTAKTPLNLRFTTEDWVECFKDLTRAELGVLYYIRTLDPYGDRNLEIDCTLVGKLLGIHRTSVSRDLEAGYVNSSVNQHSRAWIKGVSTPGIPHPPIPG